ncbi:elongation factor 1-beta [Candidatus Pacearchaeota archaeon]|nr:elongation factor 1-beta [Candidatus Pacearchaeota archaeon]
MGIVLVKIRLMPESPSVNLEEIKKEATKIIEKGKGKSPRFEEDPIAFGLKAVDVYFQLPEQEPLEPIEEALGRVKHVTSTQILDMRRAIG